ncbi:MAG: hypothetical protein ACR2MW_02005 [Chthoniobacterales bacterium]
MMSASAVFRAILAARVVVELGDRFASVGAARLDHPVFPPFGSATELAISIIFYGILLAVTIALWFFRRWARTAFLVLVVFLIVALFIRPHPLVTSTGFLAIWTLKYTLDGLMLGMLFLPSLTEQFATRKA